MSAGYTDDWQFFGSDIGPTDYRYWIDIHPKSKLQYDRQNFVKHLWGIGQLYSQYLEDRSQEEYNAKKMAMYGLGFSDITYPHLSSLLSPSSSSRAASAAWSFSQNIRHLYR